jgi:hypothetical protein
MKTSKLLVAAFATALSAVSAGAQATVNCGGSSEPALGATCNVTNTVSAIVPSVARLSITTSNTPLTAPQAADFGVGGNGNQVQTPGPTLSVSANVGHTLTASSPGNFTATAGGGSKPATDLQIKVGAGSFAAIGTLGTPATAATNLQTYPLTFGTHYNWTIDTPATYSLALTFTLTSP